MTCHRHMRAWLACASLISCLGVVGASASTLAPAAVSGQVLFSNPPAGLQVTEFGTFPLSSPQGTLRFQASGTPVPLLSADATMAPFFFGSSSGTLVYEVEVVGPSGAVPVTMTLAGGVSGATPPSGGDTFAGFSASISSRIEKIGGVLLVPEDAISTGFQTGSFDQGLDVTRDLSLQTGQVYRVSMLVNVGARAAAVTAFIDPIFSFGAGVDPAYSFSFSEGIGNSPVPEPQAWAMLAMGLAVTRSIASRRRRRALMDEPHRDCTSCAADPPAVRSII